jgi:hypothetical protein
VPAFQDCYEDLCRRGHTAPAFARNAELVAADYGLPEPGTDADRAIVFQRMVQAEPFKNLGDTIKNSRWFSVIQPSLRYDRHWGAKKVLLEHWAETMQDVAPEDFVGLNV